MIESPRKPNQFIVILGVGFSLLITIVTFIAAIFIIQNYLQQRAIKQIAASDPQAVLAEVEKIKGTLNDVEQLSIQVEALGNAAIEAQQKAEEARILSNLSEEQIAALERRLNPANGIWLNIIIGVVMLFVGYFLEKWLDKITSRFKKVGTQKNTNPPSPKS